MQITNERRKMKVCLHAQRIDPFADVLESHVEFINLEKNRLGFVLTAPLLKGIALVVHEVLPELIFQFKALERFVEALERQFELRGRLGSETDAHTKARIGT